MLLKHFIELYQKLYLATINLNKIATNNICKDVINNWKTQTQLDLYKSSIHILLSLFEEKDTNYIGKIKPVDIDAIIQSFYCKMNLEYKPTLYMISTHDEDYEISYNFYELLYIIHNLSNLPLNIYTIIDNFINNRISICVHCNKLMTLEDSLVCYQDTQGEAICDFTLKKASNQILHCNSNKSNHHPYGFDIDVKNSTKYFGDLLNRKLEKRILNQITKLEQELLIPIEDRPFNKKELICKIDNLKSKYKEIIQKIVPNTIVYYNSLRMDLTPSLGLNVPLLENKLENYKRIIKMEDNWDRIIEPEIKQLDTILNDIILVNESLEIEKNVFPTKYEKTRIIKNYRQEFSIYANNLKKQLENTNELNILLMDCEINTISLNDTILDSYYDKMDDLFNNFYIGIEVLELSTPLDSLIPIITINKFELDNCSICLENDSNQEISKIEKCGHCFHTNCIRRWLLENNSCPICRSN